MTDTAARPNRKQVRRYAVVAIVAALVGGALAWAGSVVLTPPRDVLSTTAHTFVEVVEGEVGSSLSLNTVAEWEQTPVGANRAAGTVTTVMVEPGQEVGSGTALYSVDLRPVVIGQGSVPSFRALSQGLIGPDVAQLQTVLASLGFYTSSIDSKFGARTVSAVRAWQKSLGLTADGVVQAGDLIYVPTLPARVALDPDLLEVGALLSGGEAVVSVLPASPRFSVPVTDTQAGLVSIGSRVEIEASPDLKWEGFVTGREVNENDEAVLTLEGEDGASICGEDCALIPLAGQSYLSSKVFTVESQSGLVVPSAAVQSKADGSLVVIDEEGNEHPVSLEVSARGMSLIKGVKAGLKVRVPATPE